MTTIGDNVIDMSRLVATVKKDFRLTENTILHILDINIHLSQQGKAPNMGPMPESDEELAEQLGIDVEDIENDKNETDTTDATGETDGSETDHSAG